MDDVCRFLDENGLDEYVDAFREGGIKGKLLRVMTQENLSRMVRSCPNLSKTVLPSHCLLPTQGMTELHCDILMTLIAKSKA